MLVAALCGRNSFVTDVVDQSTASSNVWAISHTKNGHQLYTLFIGKHKQAVAVWQQQHRRRRLCVDTQSAIVCCTLSFYYHARSELKKHNNSEIGNCLSAHGDAADRIMTINLDFSVHTGEQTDAVQWMHARFVCVIRRIRTHVMRCCGGARCSFSHAHHSHWCCV